MSMKLSRYIERDNTPSLIAVKTGFCEGVSQKIFFRVRDASHVVGSEGA